MLYYAAVAGLHFRFCGGLHQIVGYIVAFSNVVCAFGDSSHQSHVLHHLHVSLCACWHPDSLCMYGLQAAHGEAHDAQIGMPCKSTQ